MAEGRTRLERSLTLILTVVVASTLVAFGAAGVFQPRFNPGGGWLWGLRLAGVAAVIAGSAVLLRQRTRVLSNNDKAHDPAGAALLTAATIMSVLAILALVAPRAGYDEDALSREAANERAWVDSVSTPDGVSSSSRRPAPPMPGFGLGLGRAGSDRRIIAQAGDSEGSDGTAAGRSILGRFGPVLRWVLLVALALIIGMLMSRRLATRDRPLRIQVGVPVAAAEAGLAASLSEVRYEGRDPGEQIAAAYYRLLAALAAAGAPRRAHEAPHEHLNRTLGLLGIQPAPLHRLASLYVAAEFSERPITDDDRAEAVQVLERALQSLRRASGDAQSDEAVAGHESVSA